MVRKVTTAKVHHVHPTVWEPFRGLSVLYDLPGHTAAAGVRRLDHLPVPDGAAGRLLRRLRAAASEIADDAERAGVALALLPWRSYHVTLADTVNDGNLDQVRVDRRGEVSSVLEGLPDSLLWSNPTLRTLRARDLTWSVALAPLSFEVATVEVRGRAVVADLVATDLVAGDRPGEQAEVDASAPVRQHERARAAFGARLAAEFGVELDGWVPHVTLGYLATGADVGRAEDEVARWRRRVRSRVGATRITFRSASVYGFTDMARFWRLGG